MKSRATSHRRHLGAKRHLGRKEHYTVAPRQKFDSDTGQVYDEVEVTYKKKHGSDWIGESKTPSIVRQPPSVQPGPRSLLDMAKTKCISEFRNFTRVHFELIPWSLATSVWDEITSLHTESFHMWRTLATVYGLETEFANPDHRYHLDIRQPPLPIQEYFKGISSSEMNWVVALRLSPKQVPIPDLVAISNITNLTILDLSDGQLMLDTAAPRFNERIMRTWADLAATGKAFKHLQVLMLGWQDDVSSWLFTYLNRFPHIRHVITTDCRNMHQKNRADWESIADENGWMAHHAKKSVKLLRPLLDDRNFHLAAVSSIYYQKQDRQDGAFATLRTDDRKYLPLVECWLGTPRRWTHILDEFPGTRTVWFEKRTIGSTTQSRTQHESNIPDTVKRERDRASSLPALSLSSPPRKRSHGNGTNTRPKGPTKTAASLLADMSG